VAGSGGDRQLLPLVSPPITGNTTPVMYAAAAVAAWTPDQVRPGVASETEVSVEDET
jgi:hypothetical protein